MLSMKVSSMLYPLVKQLLVEDPNRQDDRALHFHLDCRLGFYGGPNGADAACGLHLLYQLGPGLTYVSVFSGQTESPFDKIDKVENWKHETTHDSVWGDVDCFSRVYFGLAEQVNEWLRSKSYNEQAPVRMSEHTTFALFGRAFQWVPVDVRKDPTDPYKYRKLVTIRKEV